MKGFDQNQLWCGVVALACELIAWTQLIALAGAIITAVARLQALFFG